MKFKGNRLEHPWYLEGKQVKGVYLGEYPVTGIVQESRAYYGAGGVKHLVKLDTPLWVRFDTEEPRMQVYLLEHALEKENELLEIL